MCSFLQAPTLPRPAVADSLRHALGRVFAGPEYQWVEQQRLLSWIARQWQHLKDWLDRLSLNHPVGYDIFLVLVVAALVALLVHIGYVMWRIVQPVARTGTRLSPNVAVAMNARAHLERADALAAAGRYAEALAHRFVAAVLELDERKALRFHVSKTPAEYVAEARLDATGRAALAMLVAELYRHLFGGVPCDEAEYRSFGAAAQELARGPHVVPA